MLRTLSPAAAQGAFPSRPIKLVIPSSPGGVHDIIARLWADKAQEALGSIYTENKAGAGGGVGMAQVAKARPDGMIGNLPVLPKHAPSGPRTPPAPRRGT
jgi:tripartite-type tricarboxylate transporter receptor subunit TctC